MSMSKARGHMEHEAQICRGDGAADFEMRGNELLVLRVRQQLLGAELAIFNAEGKSQNNVNPYLFFAKALAHESELSE